MAQPIDDLLTTTKSSRDISDLGARALEEGDTPDMPLQESGVDYSERLRVKNLAPDPSSAVEWLRGRGYEAQENQAGQIAVRKAGKPWSVVDPEGFDLADITDIGDELASAAATGVGAVAGAAGSGGAATIGGAALGAAGAEGARRSLGALAGFKDTPGEAAKAIAGEAVLGAGAEVGARGVTAALRGGKKAVSRLRRGKVRPVEPTADVASLPPGTPEDLEDLPFAKSYDMAVKLGILPEGKLRYSMSKKELTRALQEGVEPLSKGRHSKLQERALSKLHKGSREEVERVLNEVGDDPLTIVAQKKGGEMRTFEKAHLKPPKFAETEEATKRLDLMSERSLKELAQEMGFRSEDKSKGELVKLITEKQAGYISGRGTARSAAAREKGTLTFWEELGEGAGPAAVKQAGKRYGGTILPGRKEFGDWKRVNLENVVELRTAGGKVIRFGEDGKPLIVQGAGRAGSKAVVAPTAAEEAVRPRGKKPGRLRRGAGAALERTGKALQAPYRAEQRVVKKVSETLLGEETPEGLAQTFNRAARRYGPMAIPGYQGAAVAVRGAAVAGGAARWGAKLMRDPKALEDLMAAGPPQKILEIMEKFITPRVKDKNAYRMAIFTLMHHPEFRRWASKSTVSKVAAEEERA